MSKQQFEAAWQPYALPDTNGITEFMRVCVQAVANAGLNLSFERYDRTPPGEYYFAAAIPGTSYVAYVNLDGVEVSIPNGKALLRAERWDYDSPKQLIEAFVAVLTKLNGA